MIIITFDNFSSEEERLRKLDKLLSTRSKTYRAKRVDINVKINVAAYLVELLGGLITCLLALLLKVNVSLFVVIWYGNVIPSCYLINSDDSKDTIMDEGWRTAFFNLYQNREEKERQKRESTYRTAREESKRDNSGKSQASKTEKLSTMENRSLEDQLRSEVILHDLKDIACNTKTTTGKSYIPQTESIRLNHESKTRGITPSIQYITTTPKKFFPGSEEDVKNNINFVLPNQVEDS